MVQIKYKFMAENMFRFYRGTCHLFYEDLNLANTFPHSPLTWICGDLHLENFGGYRGDNRQVYFDLNDFDEALLAPATWEVVRMAASIFVAYNSLKLEQKKALNMTRQFLKNYSAILSKGKAKYVEPKTSCGIVANFLTAINDRKQKDLLRKHSVKKKDKLIILMDDQRHFEIDKLLKKDLFHHITEWMRNNGEMWLHYEVIDAVFRLAGTGSVGVKRYVLLLKGLKGRGKYLLVEMKQAKPSSIQPYINIPQPHWESEAERVVAIQQRMQNVPSALLSATLFKGEAYSIQEMQPTRDSVSYKLMKDQYRDVPQLMDDIAMLTASAQLRSSGRQGASVSDELIAFGQNNQWQDVILEYAQQYAQQVKKDYKEFLKALEGNFFK